MIKSKESSRSELDTELKITFRSVQESRKTQSGGLPLNQDEELNYHVDQNERLKLRLLAYQMNIQNGETIWYELALALARIHHPEPNKRGRKTKWDLEIRIILIIEINRLIKPENQRYGIEYACGVLSNRPHWKRFLKNNKNLVQALRRNYYESTADEKLIEAAQAYYKENQGNWDSHVNQIISSIVK